MAFDPSIKLFGQTYNNPIVPASGTFGCGEVYRDLLDYGKIGAFCTKAVTPEVRIGNIPQRLVETPSGLLNAIGLQNEGLEAFIKEKIPHLVNLPCHAWVNVSGKTFEDYQTVVEALNDYDTISAFEINVSCPNVHEGGMTIGTSPDQVGRLTSLLKGVSKKPLIVKLSPNVTDLPSIARTAEDNGADALTVANTFLGMAIDIERRKPVLGNVTGGLSGPAIKPMALRCVWFAYKAVKIPIIACGGVMTGSDALEFILAGATMVQVGTVIFKDPTAPAKIASEMSSWAESHGFDSYSQLKGAAHESS
jgi:dihydroorotate dehydrogenase (NAD+) catalytic subunit